MKEANKLIEALKRDGNKHEELLEILLCPLEHLKNCDENRYWDVTTRLHSDYGNILGDNLDTYINMDRAYINDKDAQEGKAFREWKAKSF